MSNDKRALLIKYVHQYGLSISKASHILQIYYPTAKAINKVFLNENRVEKKSFRTSKKQEAVFQPLSSYTLTAEALTKAHAETPVHIQRLMTSGQPMIMGGSTQQLPMSFALPEK